jgi:hypothetical protein
MRDQELRGLAAELGGEHPGRTAITVSMPVRPDGTERDAEATRLRNLVRSVTRSLDALGLERGVRERLESQLDALPEAVARANGRRGRGLVCYLTADVTRVVRLGHAPQERALVSDTFSLALPIADLLAADDVDVLVLSTGGNDTEGARHYRLEDDVLHEQVDEHLPASWDVRDAETRYAESRETSPSRDARLEDFLRRVDQALLGRFGNPHDRQLVVIGIERLHTHWDAVADPANRRAVVARIVGNVDHVPVSELTRRVIAAVEMARHEAARTAVTELEALDPSRTAVGVDDVVTLARAGRLHRLLVEEGATAEVEVDGVVIGDRIANAMRAAFDAGTEVLLAPAGALTAHGGVAGVVRW